MTGVLLTPNHAPQPSTSPAFRATEYYDDQQVQALWTALVAGMPAKWNGPGDSPTRSLPSLASFERLLKWIDDVEDFSIWISMATRGEARIWECPEHPGEFNFEETPRTPA